MIFDDPGKILMYLASCFLGWIVGRLVASIVTEREIKKEIERMKEERGCKHNE